MTIDQNILKAYSMTKDTSTSYNKAVVNIAAARALLNKLVVWAGSYNETNTVASSPYAELKTAYELCKSVEYSLLNPSADNDDKIISAQSRHIKHLNNELAKLNREVTNQDVYISKLRTSLNETSASYAGVVADKIELQAALNDTTKEYNKLVDETDAVAIKRHNQYQELLAKYTESKVSQSQTAADNAEELLKSKDEETKLLKQLASTLTELNERNLKFIELSKDYYLLECKYASIKQR